MYAKQYPNFVLPSLEAESPPSIGAIRTSAELIDFNAEKNPDHLFCVQINPSGRVSECTNHLRITYQTFRDMIRGCQIWIEKNIPRAQSTRDDFGNITKSAPIAILSDSDVSLLVYVFALVGLGVPVGSSQITFTSVTELGRWY